MENGAPRTPQSSSPPRWLIGLSILAIIGAGGLWYLRSTAPITDTKYAFSLSHYFEDPIVFYGGKGLQYASDASDSRRIRVNVPVDGLESPRYLLVEDGELDYLGFVNKDQLFIPLELFQIHNDRPGRPEAPVTDCKTYLEVQSTADTILVLIDKQYILRGIRVSPNLYAIPFCETTREHEFQIIGQYPTGSMAMKGLAPATYAYMGVGTGATTAQPRGGQPYRLRYSGDTIRMAAYSPAMYGATTQPEAIATPEKKDPGNTKVTVSLPRRLQSPWVYLNNKRITTFTLNNYGNQVSFWVKRSTSPIQVRVGDSNCECQASGYPQHSTLELAAYCECRDIQVNVQLDPGLDRYRNKIRVYINGQLTDMALPPAGQPLTFPVRKTDQDQRVDLKLLMVDDTGQAGLIDVCNFTVPREVTTSNISPSCHCSECPPNIKISG